MVAVLTRDSVIKRQTIPNISAWNSGVRRSSAGVSSNFQISVSVSLAFDKWGREKMEEARECFEAETRRRGGRGEFFGLM